jgi:hypothetical protein
LDLSRIIQDLHSEQNRITELIHALEEVQKYYASRPAREASVRRRGRKSMGEDERLQVSQRMRKYWAMRRASEEGQTWAATG